MKKRIATHSEKETFELAEQLAGDAMPGEVYALLGDLGVGKSVFARGFAAGLGISGPITSPTFTIVCEYEDGRLPFYHFDVYRIEEPDELFETGFDEYVGGRGICLIEWADRIARELPHDTVFISIEKDYAAMETEEPGSEDLRNITIEGK